ncbi:MipA/OmpV family protein [Microbulbifer sp. SA54]|uniref:MipA/OmpV family protein n=1 Tax=Microbulbifer sp. SA54 TaxID=3401577 RepID=UPI003AAF52C1
MNMIRIWLLLSLSLLLSSAIADEIDVRVSGAPSQGTLVLQVYDNPNTFGSFRDPALEQRYAIRADGVYRLSNVPVGAVAVLAYIDTNGNGALDKTFIGIPKEPIGLSNRYRPKGPPSFQRASFDVAAGQMQTLDVELYQVLGEAGQWGVGIGVIGRSSPYVDSDTNVVKVIPAITYFGERLQWVGPQLRYGVIGSDQFRLAVTAAYRVGVYEEDDSPALQGLGDRDDTLMAGIGLVYEGLKGTEVDFRYEHDVLDRIGGGAASLTLSRGLQWGNLRVSPSLGVNWLSSDLATYDFGVPASAELSTRPAYDVGSSVNVEAGIGGLFEITEHWRVVLNLSAEFLDSEISDSPIVADDHVLKGFAAITYTF